MKEITAIGQIIDAEDISEISRYLIELPYGQLCSIKKMLELEYQRVETTKDALQKQILNETLMGDSVCKAQEVISQLYIALQKIEDRCTLVECLKGDK